MGAATSDHRSHRRNEVVAWLLRRLDEALEPLDCASAVSFTASFDAMARFAAIPIEAVAAHVVGDGLRVHAGLEELRILRHVVLGENGWGDYDCEIRLGLVLRPWSAKAHHDWRAAALCAVSIDHSLVRGAADIAFDTVDELRSRVLTRSSQPAQPLRAARSSPDVIVY